MFSFKFNSNEISRATALSNVGIIAYMFGSFCFDTRKCKYSIKKSQYISNQIITIVTLMVLCLFFLVVDPSFYYKTYGSANTNSISGYILLLFSSLIITSIIIEFNNNRSNEKHLTLYQILISSNKLLMITIISFLSVFLFIGSRTLPLQVLLLILCLYSILIKPISFKKFFLFALIGMFFMSFLSIFRLSRGIGGSGIKQNFSFNLIDSAMDLIINNRNSYVVLDYVDKNGITYGKSMMGSLLAPMPFFQSFVFKLFDIDQSFTTSSKFFTRLTLGENSSLGLGTNIIADLYLGFGFLGVIFLMFFLGFFVNRSKDLAEKGHFYSMVCYGVMTSYSVYLVRAEFFFFLRLLLWSLIIANIFKLHQFKFKSFK